MVSVKLMLLNTGYVRCYCYLLSGNGLDQMFRGFTIENYNQIERTFLI